MEKQFKNVVRFSIVLLIAYFPLHSQTDIISAPDTMPKFIYGNEHYARFLSSNINYPWKATLKKVEGKVYLSFVVDTAGKVSDVKILKDIGDSCGEEAKRVMELTSGLWEPGFYQGKKVKVRMNMPVTFVHQKSESNAFIIRIKPSADYYYNLGVKEFGEGRFLTAIIYFTQALDVKPDHIDALYNRGVAKMKSNDKDGACKDWRNGVILNDEGAVKLVIKYCQ